MHGLRILKQPRKEMRNFFHRFSFLIAPGDDSYVLIVAATFLQNFSHIDNGSANYWLLSKIVKIVLFFGDKNVASNMMAGVLD